MMQAAAVSDRRGFEKSKLAFRTISEVATELDVAQHVLRFWGSKFPQIRPVQKSGGRRYYRPEDTELLRRIRSLLYDEGYTIKGVQRLLRGGAPTSGNEPAVAKVSVLPRRAKPEDSKRAAVQGVLKDLENALQELRAALYKG